MGLGSIEFVSLHDARVKAAELRRMREAGIDPLEARREEEERAQLEAARAVTFRQCAEGFLAAHEESWRNLKHRQQWRSTLEAYVYPTLGDRKVQTIDTPAVLEVLEPIWSTKPETAKRVRGRIESILDWAKAKKFRSGENPAAWRGNLAFALPRRAKMGRVRNHPALPYDRLSQFYATLAGLQSVSAAALRFLILTTSRTGEVLGARWSEINLEARTWTKPADRMKAGREHRVPLSTAALAVLAEMQPLRQGSDFVFPGQSGSRPLSNMALEMVIRRMNSGSKPPRWVDGAGEAITPHGFRSSFKDWAAECTQFPNEVSEMALAHAVGDKVEAAYRRGDMFEKRRALMDAWADHCLGKPTSPR